MKRFIFLIFFQVSLFASSEVNNSILKIYSTVKQYNYVQPWSPPQTVRFSGSGFVIAGNQVITNAHVVENATFIELRSALSKKKYEARVKMIGHDCDMAILEVDDPSFFEDKIPLEFSEGILHQEEEVHVYGFPIGGKELSITKGIVSRVEVGQYAHSGEVLLLSQIDASINPGNSGGPVIANGKVVGIAHQGSSEGQNIGYMVPIPVIQHFLKENPECYQGFPSPSFTYQKISNDGMRSFYHLEKHAGGLLIINVSENHFFHGLLKPGDILLEVDGKTIDSSGEIYDEELDLTLPFQYLIIMKHFGDEIAMTLLRDGEKIAVQGPINLEKKGKDLVPYNVFDKGPTYYILGGCVFQPLVGNFIRSDYRESEGFPGIDLMYYLFRGEVKGERDEIVILSSVLDDKVNRGYQHLEKKVVHKLNGKKVNNLRDFIVAVEECKDAHFVITTTDNIEVILDRELALQRNHIILKRYYIPSDRSVDLQ